MGEQIPKIVEIDVRIRAAAKNTPQYFLVFAHFFILA